MLSNKKSLYILLPVVLLIWGILIYKVVSGSSPDQEETEQFISSASNITYKPQERITYELLPVERDPFLGTTYKKKTTPFKKSTPKPTPVVNWPQISYAGNVTGSPNQIYLVSINGTQHLMSPGDIINEVKLVSGTKERVTLQYQNKRKQFSRNQ